MRLKIALINSGVLLNQRVAIFWRLSPHCIQRLKPDVSQDRLSRYVHSGGNKCPFSLVHNMSKWKAIPDHGNAEYCFPHTRTSQREHLIHNLIELQHPPTMRNYIVWLTAGNIKNVLALSSVEPFQLVPYGRILVHSTLKKIYKTSQTVAILNTYI